MSRTNPKNDRVKREFLVHLKDSRQRSAATVDQARHAIDRFEVYTGFKLLEVLAPAVSCGVWRSGHDWDIWGLRGQRRIDLGEPGMVPRSRVFGLLARFTCRRA
jgi:hypothetical protein